MPSSWLRRRTDLLGLRTTESLTAATLSCVRDDFGRPECDCLFLSFALRLFTVPWVLNFLTHPQITELTGNSRQLKWSLNRNCVSRKDFSRKYVSTANVFCSVVQGISKLTRGRLLDQSVFLMNLKQITELLEYCGNYSTFYELCFFCVTLYNRCSMHPVEKPCALQGAASKSLSVQSKIWNSQERMDFGQWNFIYVEINEC